MTAIREARKYLYDTFTDSESLADTDVLFGWDDKPGPRSVIVGGVTPDSTEWAAVGRQRRNETFSLLLQVEVRDPGHQNREESDTVADEICTTVLGLLAEREHSTCGRVLSKPVKAVVTGWENFNGGDRPVTVIQITLECEART